MKKDYLNWSKDELIKELKKLEKRKKYGVVWEDKAEEVAELCKEKLPILEEEEKKEIKTDELKPVNIFIEGDNYHALSVLNYTHKGAVDLIYIDPPYNTGSDDFKYNDRIVDEEDSYRHSKWLSFMEKRLKLAKNVLKNDGIILISIDDNEAAQLKLLLDEIFGEENRLSTHHIQVRYADKTLNEKNDWQPVMEYVFIYAKNNNSFKANKPSVEYSIDKFVYEIKELTQGAEISVKNRKVKIFKKSEWEIIKHKSPDKNLLKEIWVSGSIYSGTGNGAMVRNIIEPRVEIDGYGSVYKIEGLGEDGLGYRYFTGPQRIGANRSKMYMGIPITKLEGLNSGTGAIKFKSIPNIYDFSPDFGNIRHEGGVPLNSGKKPVKMLKQFISYHRNKNAIVLDFFAGSGSLAHATLALNAEDGGERKFIVCTNNENNIASDICYPRISNVIKGYNHVNGLGGNLKYFKTDFVYAELTDENKRKLVDKSTEMLCLKEYCFDELEKGKDFRIFTDNKSKLLGIIYDDDGIEPFKKAATRINKEFIVYVFSLDDSAREEEFEDIAELVELRPIPAVILNVYRRIFK